MSEAGDTFRKITGALATILAIVKIISYLVGPVHHAQYTPPPMALSTQPPMTAEQKLAAERNSREVAEAIATARKLFDEGGASK